MKFAYKFSNLCGTVYAQGNLLFTPQGGSLLSPVGNRVTVFDLENSKSVTLPFENRKNISCIALSPDASTLITVDEEGHALLINYRRGVVLNYFNFNAVVNALVFSPDGKYFAVTHENHVQLWAAPSLQREFAPFVLHRTFTGHYDEVVSIDWAADSQSFVTGSRDLTARIYSLDKSRGPAVILGGHREPVIAAFLPDEHGCAYTVARDGSLFVWRHDTEQDSTELVVGKKRHHSGHTGGQAWKREARHFFNQAKAVCATIHKKSKLLVVGFTSGIFGLYELPDCTNIHTLSISSQKITTVSVNSTGEWLAFGSRQLGQLLVWEWQSETYVLKQQGHSYGMNAMDYSANGALIATGGEDGKVKLWNTTSGFCFVTFAEHVAPVQAVRFVASGNAVLSASLDGTVRAFDLVRYRNFRTLTTPTPTQFASLAVDATGDLVCAGTQDSFEIFVWSLRTGRLLEALSGHEGPVSGLYFSPLENVLASCSWDKSVKLWDVLESKVSTLSLPHSSEVLCLAIRPDGKELVASTMDGHLVFWNAIDGNQVGTIECRRDVAGGRKSGDKSTFAAQAAASFFTTVCYSADGRCVLAGGSTKWVCIYHVARRVCIRKYAISANRSLDGVAEQLHSGRMTEAGPLDEIDHDSDAERGDRDDRRARDEAASLPGAVRGAAATRGGRRRPAAATRCARFAPTGRAWAAATTEGLLVYSMDRVSDFDPLDLDIDLTPAAALAALGEGEYLKALLMALRLNEAPLVRAVYERVPPADVPLVAAALPTGYLERALQFLAAQAEATPHLEFHLLWAREVLMAHGAAVESRRAALAPALRALHKAASGQYEDLAQLSQSNLYTLEFLAAAPDDDDEDGGGADAVGGAAAGGRDDEEGGGGANGAAGSDDEGEWLGGP